MWSSSKVNNHTERTQVPEDDEKKSYNNDHNSNKQIESRGTL